MGDLGDIFDMFSQDDEKKQRKGQSADSQDESNRTDPKRLIIGKLVKNRALLIATVCVGIAVVGAAAYFLVGYVNDHGTQSIMDNIKPFVK
jgi:hypothetical protein